MKNRLIALLTAGALTLGSVGPAIADNGRGKGNGHGSSKKFSDNYKDWDSNFWGNESLSRLILMGIMKGDGFGQLNPNKPVTRLEAAITIIRLLGLEKTDKPVQVDEEDREETPEWGMEAVLIGLQHGFLEGGKGKLQPMKPLTRLEAAVLLVKAAGLKAEAEAKAGAALPFKDTQKISAAAKGYLAIAIEKGFIRGMEDNTFKPEKPLTRAEWATMLDRLDRTEGPAVRPDGRQVKGEVVAVTTVDGIAALKVNTPVYPGGVTYKFDDAAVLYRDRQEITLADVQAGDDVILQLSPDRTILMLTVYSPAPEVQAVEGAVTAFTAPTATAAGSISFKPASGEAKSLPVAANATVKLGDQAGALTDVMVGDQVKLTVTNGAVTAIQIKVVTEELTGTIKSVTAGTATARPKVTITTGSPATDKSFEVVDWAEIEYEESDEELTLADLEVGMQVELKVQRNLITKISVLDELPEAPAQTISGKVMTWVAPTATAEGSIVINTTGAEMKLFTVIKGAQVKLNDHAVTLADLKVNDSVTLTLTEEKVSAIQIKATASQMTGTLTAVATPSGGARAQLTIESGDTTKTIAVASWATVAITGNDDDDLTLADLAVGSTVKLTVLHDLVTKVEVTALPVVTEEIEGEVMAWIAPAGTQAGSVALLVDGEMVLLPIAPNATVKLNGHLALFADVLVGDEVTLTVSDNVVTAVEMEAAVTTTSGTLKAVTAATTSARAQLTIESGDPAQSRTLAVASWAEIELEGSDEEMALADLVLDSAVELQVSHGLIVKITVTELPEAEEDTSTDDESND